MEASLRIANGIYNMASTPRTQKGPGKGCVALTYQCFGVCQVNPFIDMYRVSVIPMGDEVETKGQC